MPLLRRPRSPHAPDSPVWPDQHARIAVRLRWSYLISSTLPLLVVGSLLLNLNLSAQQSSIYNDQTNLTNGTARSIARYVAELHQQLQEYSLLVRPGSSQPAQWEQSALSLQSRNYPNITELAVLDLQGHEQMRVHNLQAVRGAGLQDLHTRVEVTHALAGRSGYSAIVTNGERQHTFTMTLPLQNDAGSIVGVLQAELRADLIVDELHASSGTSGNDAYLVQPDNGSLLLDNGTPLQRISPDLAALIQTNGGTAEYTGARNERVLGAAAPVILPGSAETTGWFVVIERPADLAFAAVKRSLLLLVLLGIVVGVLALLWAFWQARQFTRPLKALQLAARALGDGQLNHRLIPPGDDELGDLARAFNQMADRLQHSLDHIERQNERLRQGLALARDIQVGLLPSGAPWDSATMDVYARSIPAYEVGGDFYTYLALSEQRAAIAIGDISGKGVGAALLMALTSSAVETHGRQLEHPAAVLSMLNKLLMPRLRANHMNAALLFAVFDPHAGLLRVANAGMIAPVLIAPTGSTFLDVVGLPLGAIDNACYHETVVTIRPGDALLLLSDGVVEAHNPQGELFGFERLDAVIAGAAVTGDVRTLVEVILQQVQTFMDGAEQHDDLTLVAIRPALTGEAMSSVDEEQAVSYATL